MRAEIYHIDDDKDDKSRVTLPTGRSKRITKPMLGSKDFRCERIVLSGVELMHMIRKG